MQSVYTRALAGNQWQRSAPFFSTIVVYNESSGNLRVLEKLGYFHFFVIKTKISEATHAIRKQVKSSQNKSNDLCIANDRSLLLSRKRC